MHNFGTSDVKGQASECLQYLLLVWYRGCPFQWFFAYPISGDPGSKYSYLDHPILGTFCTSTIPQLVQHGATKKINEHVSGLLAVIQSLTSSSLTTPDEAREIKFKTKRSMTQSNLQSLFAVVNCYLQVVYLAVTMCIIDSIVNRIELKMMIFKPCL